MTTNIYPFLKPYFWATLVSAVISALSSNNNNSILISVISLITSVICLYELYQMRTISDHLSRAFSYQIIGTIGALASLIIGLLALLANPITNMGFMVFTLIIALIFAIIGIIGSYHFYWGLDELIEPNGYDYPVGRIKMVLLPGVYRGAHCRPAVAGAGCISRHYRKRRFLRRAALPAVHIFTGCPRP